MSLTRIKHSFTVFMRNDRKSKHAKAKSMNSITTTILKTPQDTAVALSAANKTDENTYFEDFFSTYHDPSVLDIRRSVKHGLNGLPKISVTIMPTASIRDALIPCTPLLPSTPVFEDALNTTQQLVMVPKAPLLPSTPVFGDSFAISFNVPPSPPPSPYTPSLVFSTPPVSPRVLDALTPAFSKRRVVKIGDLQILQFLSKGGWGEVHLAKDTITNKRLALKVMKRSDKRFAIPTLKQFLIQEKNIMASLQGCDWFAQLEASWCDSNNLYLAMTYYPTDLESEILRCEKLSDARARYYMAEMIIALEELHKRGIIHRDIKVSNILIRADGHIVLADFGLSKNFGRKTTLAERSYQPYWPFRTDDDVVDTPYRTPAELTFVAREALGSEMEMAPEIILRKYYSFGVDYWAAAISLYIMVTGLSPWSEEGEKDVQTQILEDEIIFEPQDEVSEECQDFIMRMLKKEPSERLRIGLDMISHPYFVGIDWEAMRNRIVPAPWVPNFVSGHHFYEDWDSLDFFEAGDEVDKNEDEFQDFFYTSPGMERCVETSLENFFNFSSEDQFSESEDDFCNEFEEDYEERFGTVNFFPVISVSDSHTSISASFYSASSLRPGGLDCGVERVSEHSNTATEDGHEIVDATDVVIPVPDLAQVPFAKLVTLRLVGDAVVERVVIGGPVSTPFGAEPATEVQKAGVLKRFSPLILPRAPKIPTSYARNATIWGMIKGMFKNLRKLERSQDWEFGSDLC